MERFDGRLQVFLWDEPPGAESRQARLRLRRREAREDGRFPFFEVYAILMPGPRASMSRRTPSGRSGTSRSSTRRRARRAAARTRKTGRSVARKRSGRRMAAGSPGAFLNGSGIQATPQPGWAHPDDRHTGLPTAGPAGKWVRRLKRPPHKGNHRGDISRLFCVSYYLKII
jgi:hypothetical protein